MQYIGSRFILLPIVLIVLWWAVLGIRYWSTPVAVFGWNLGSDGTTLSYITPGLPADRAGLRVGDRVEWSTLPTLGRANLALVQNVEPGTRLTLKVWRGDTPRIVALQASPEPLSVTLSHKIDWACTILVLLIAAALVYLRASRMTWGFLLAQLSASPIPLSVGHWAQRSPWDLIVGNGLAVCCAGLGAAGILIFTTRFPRDRPPGVLVWLDRAAIPVGSMIAALYLYRLFVIAFSATPPMAVTPDYVVNITLLVAALAALVVNYAASAGSDRQRVVPVLTAFALTVLAGVGINLVNDVLTNNFIYSIVFPLQALATILLAAAVLYSVLRHRVFDVSFALSKTVVYTIVTSLVVGVFVLIDFISSKILADLRFALALEACAALALGIWLNALHSRIDRFVDRVMFRKRHLAEARLERAARTLPHAQACEYIDETLVTEACDALDLASAAVFRRADGRFERMRSNRWDARDAAAISGDDPLAVVLRAELEAIDLAEIHRAQSDFPAGAAQPLIAIPLAVRHELLGFVLYGGHTGGEAIDPDEQRILMHVARAASAAYEYVRATDLQDEARQLRTENALLRQLSGVPTNG
ncbi:MAG TPA: GAF domain-containing protein [Candidatus Baltobacteraceae bacterium]|nr:GAF domain-containing protein [Candidatus Baltobacteraceae bacterium]